MKTKCVIYGNKKNWIELRAWFLNNMPSCLQYMYPQPDQIKKPITEIGYGSAMYVLLDCPLNFVVDQLRKHYGKNALEEYFSKEELLMYSKHTYKRATGTDLITTRERLLKELEEFIFDTQSIIKG